MHNPANAHSGSTTTARRVLEAYAALTPGATGPRRVAAGDITWLGQSLDRTATVAEPFGRTADGPRMRNSPFDYLEFPAVRPGGSPASSVAFPLAPDTPLPDPPRLVAFAPGLHGTDVVDASGQPINDGDRVLQDLAGRTRLSGPSSELRLGWVYLAGRVEVEGKRERLLVPLLWRRVDLVRSGALARGIRTATSLTASAEWELAPRTDWTCGLDLPPGPAAEELVEHPVWWSELPPDVASGRSRRDHRRQLRTWVTELAAAAGVEVADVTLDHPALHEDDDAIVACLGYGLLRTDERTLTGTADTLRAWSERVGIEETAFAALLRGSVPVEPSMLPANTVVRSPVELNRSQERIVVAARSATTTVVSGAPGTGKSHLVTAIAADLTFRGETVLVATRSTYAADVLAGMLDRRPGPVPIRFGSPRARQAALDEIEHRLAEREVSGAGLLLDEAELQRTTLHNRVAGLLARVEAASTWERRCALLPAHREAAPGLFEDGCDLQRAGRLLARLEPGLSPWSRWWAGRALRRLGRCDDLTTLPDALATALADVARRAADGVVEQLAGLWDDLAAAEREARRWTGQEMDDLVDERAASADGRTALTSLHAALRSGTASRQRLLETLPPSDLARAAPLWLGTLGEIEQLLPRTPSMFDVVILDEASQIDQPSAAAALLRASRSVIVGDPHQLRHVSFVADDAQAAAFDAASITEDARLDVRRNSVLDLAAGASPVRWLSEHHRSVPHLIQFSVDHFYAGRVELATRHPGNECTDVIDVVRTDGDVVARVDGLLRELEEAGLRSVGVVTPFRELADAIAERVVTAAGGSARIEALDLQVGTVHQFQGSERDVIVVVPGIAADDPPGRRAFATDPHLFNVMITRARRRMLIVTDLPATGGDLLAEFLAWAGSPPPRVPDGRPTSEFARRLGQAIADADGIARYAYPVGDWIVDLCVGDGRQAVGVMCGVHPEGPAAHIERHLALTASGWRLRDPVVDRGDGIVELALDLLGSDEVTGA